MRRGLLVALLLVASACHAAPGRTPAPPPPLTEAWRWSAPPPASMGMPATDGRELAATWGHDHLVVLGESGRLRWEAELLGLRDVAPALVDTLVVAATDDGVAAFDRGSGGRRWTTMLGERASTPVVVAGRAVVTTWEGNLFALELADGARAWSRPLPGPSLGHPATANGIVVATWVSDDGSSAGAVGVDAVTGAERWSTPLPPSAVSGPAIASGSPHAPVVVAVAGDVRVHALELATGAPRWTAALSGAGSPEVPPAPVPGGVIVADRMTGLASFGAGGGQRWATPGPGAAVRGGPAVLDTGDSHGLVALPIDEGGALVLTTGGKPRAVLEPPGRVVGVAAFAGRLVTATREAETNALIAYDPPNKAPP